MRIYIYSRKSVWTGKGESIENQVELCRRYIAGHIASGQEAEIFVYEDEGFSGKNLDRPQFQKMMADSRKHKPDYIVCYRLDRISRSVGDFAPLVEDLMAREISLICIKEQFDTSTPMGKAMMYIASVFAQLERETIAERIRDNMLLLARTGRWLGGAPPTGFQSEKVEDYIIDGKVKTSFQLKTDPQEIGMVRLMFQKYLELRSLNGVAQYLLRAGFRNRSGRPYSLPGIKDILRNPVYCTADQTARTYFAGCGSDVCFSPEQCSDKYGLLSYNRRGYARKGRSRLDKTQWIIAIGKHRGAVSGAAWVEVQQLLAEKSEKNTAKPPQSFNDYSLLSGLLFCSRCGARMFAKKRSNSETLYDYICANKLRTCVLCDCQNLSGRQADRLVGDFLLDHVRLDAGISRLLDALEKRVEDQAPADPAGSFDVQIEKTQQEIDRLTAALAAGGNESVARYIGKRMEALEAEQKCLKAAKSQALPILKESKQTAFPWILTGCKESFSNLTIYEKRDFVRLFLNRLEWDGTDLHLYMYGEPKSPRPFLF